MAIPLSAQKPIIQLARAHRRALARWAVDEVDQAHTGFVRNGAMSVHELGQLAERLLDSRRATVRTSRISCPARTGSVQRIRYTWGCDRDYTDSGFGCSPVDGNLLKGVCELMANKSRADKQQRKREQKLKRLERHPPRLGHESMMDIPAFRKAATALIEHLRGAADAPIRLVSEDDLEHPTVRPILQDRYAFMRQRHGWSHEDAVLEIHQLCTHLATAVNHALVGKKTFWVSGDLAEALRHTNLDIPGDVLELPFTVCAFVWSDALTLELAQTLIDRHTTRRTKYHTLTVYVYPSRKEVEAGFELVFLADAYDGEWPYMISRSVLTDGKRNLDEILDSHPEESIDEMFREREMAELLRLAVNAVLYTTSADYRQEWRAPAPRGFTPKHVTLSGDGVYYLPGRIRIGAEAPDDPSRPTGGTGTTIIKRFWVRGHWRRANPSWQDQRVRWIVPYLKGPDVAAIVERQYELVGSRMAATGD